MNRKHRLAALLVLIGLGVILATFRLATAPGFIAMLGGSTIVVAGMARFAIDLLRGV